MSRSLESASRRVGSPCSLIRKRASGKAGDTVQRDLGSVLILIRTGVGTGFIPCLHISHRQDKYTNDKYSKSHLLMPGNVKESFGTWSRLPAANIAKVDCHVRWLENAAVCVSLLFHRSFAQRLYSRVISSIGPVSSEAPHQLKRGVVSVPVYCAVRTIVRYVPGRLRPCPPTFPDPDPATVESPR